MTDQTPDPMPVFVLKAKDDLTYQTVEAYLTMCDEFGLDAQVIEVRKAMDEIAAWRSRNPDLCKMPDHPHVPVGGTPRPAPVGSWWRQSDGAIVQVDGDYLDGPGDQIVTYTLYRQFADVAHGKWGGKELAAAYTRIEAHEVPDWVEVAW